MIFKCVNNTMGLSFKVIFAEKSTYGFREQCMVPPLKNARTQMHKHKRYIKTHTKLKSNEIIQWSFC